MNLETVIGQDFTIIGTGRYLRTAEHDSLVIDKQKQLFYWNSRNIYGNIKDWFTKVKGCDNFVLTSTLNSVKVQTTKKYNKKIDESLLESFYSFGKSNRDYWLTYRGYNHSTIDLFKLGYTGEWYVIPIILDGKLQNFQCRKRGAVRMWYSIGDVHPFNFDSLPVTNTVFLTEGPPDAIMLEQNGLTAVSQTGGAGQITIYEKNFYRFYDKKQIYITYDNDKAGNYGSKRLAKVFGSKAKIYNFWDYSNGFDVSDYFNSGKTAEQLLVEIYDKGRYWWEM